MKFSLDGAEDGYLIHAYDGAKFRVGRTEVLNSLVIGERDLDERWPVDAIDALDEAALNKVVERFQPEVLVLGTGERQHFPDPALFASLMNAGIGFEVMDTAAACRTFNVLRSEGRKVVAALILEVPT